MSDETQHCKARISKRQVYQPGGKTIFKTEHVDDECKRTATSVNGYCKQHERIVNQLEFGKRLRDVGMGVVLENSDESYKQNVMDVIGQLAASGYRFTAEDIREIAGSPTGHPNVLGALMHGAVKTGIIKRVDYAKATRARSHARVIAVYVGTQEPLEFKNE